MILFYNSKLKSYTTLRRQVMRLFAVNPCIDELKTKSAWSLQFAQQLSWPLGF